MRVRCVYVCVRFPQNYWKSFVAAIGAATAAQLLRWMRYPQNEALSPFVEAPVTRDDTSFPEYFIALLLGVVLGVAGIGMVQVSSKDMWRVLFLSPQQTHLPANKPCCFSGK